MALSRTARVLGPPEGEQMALSRTARVLGPPEGVSALLVEGDQEQHDADCEQGAAGGGEGIVGPDGRDEEGSTTDQP